MKQVVVYLASGDRVSVMGNDLDLAIWAEDEVGGERKWLRLTSEFHKIGLAEEQGPDGKWTKMVFELSDTARGEPA